MRELIEGYRYCIPLVCKKATNCSYEYRHIVFNNVKWKLWDFDLKNIKQIESNEFVKENRDLNKEAQYSLWIDDINKKNNEDFIEHQQALMNAYTFINKNEILSLSLIKKIYKKITKNETLVNEDEMLTNYSDFRYSKTFFNGIRNNLTGTLIENCLIDLFKLVDFFMDNDEHFLAATIAHMFIFVIQPFPTNNGKLARMVFSWIISKKYNDSLLSNYIYNNERNYNKAIYYSMKYHDLTYITIFMWNALAENSRFNKKYVSIDGEHYDRYYFLNNGEQIVLYNMCSINEMMSWSEYKEYFNDKRTKQQINNIFRKLEMNDLIKSKIFNNNLKRYYIES